MASWVAVTQESVRKRPPRRGLAWWMARASWALPVYALVRSGGTIDALAVFGVAMALFITWTHRANVQRMLAGNENRFEKVMLLRRLRG